MAKKKYYAVKIGRVNDTVVGTWDECSELVTGFSGARFKSFTSAQDAHDYLNSYVQPAPAKAKPKSKPKKKRRDFWDGFPCLERKMLLCKFTRKMRSHCVKRKGPTIVGDNYQPTGETSIPWD